jgi:hypothetical protein
MQLASSSQPGFIPSLRTIHMYHLQSMQPDEAALRLFLPRSCSCFTNVHTGTVPMKFETILLMEQRQTDE